MPPWSGRHCCHISEHQMLHCGKLMVGVRQRAEFGMVRSGTVRVQTRGVGCMEMVEVEVMLQVARNAAAWWW